MDETFNRDSTNWCKYSVGIHASQHFILSMCQAMPTGLYTIREVDSESGKLETRQNKTRSFRIIVISYFQRVIPESILGIFYTTGTQKTFDAYSVAGFCGNCNTVFETMGCYHHCCPCQEGRPFFTEEKIQRGVEKRELDEQQKQYIQEKSWNVLEMYENDWWKR